MKKERKRTGNTKKRRERVNPKTCVKKKKKRKAFQRKIEYEKENYHKDQTNTQTKKEQENKRNELVPKTPVKSHQKKKFLREQNSLPISITPDPIMRNKKRRANFGKKPINHKKKTQQQRIRALAKLHLKMQSSYQSKKEQTLSDLNKIMKELRKTLKKLRNIQRQENERKTGRISKKIQAVLTPQNQKKSKSKSKNKSKRKRKMEAKLKIKKKN
eukprot:Anaeramoba_flamelloidesa570097_16.p1 GENE.a570097_16~~a570097_16.p1  ORF type:complete len:215 (-),score=80.23 a570097_16:81-725(-)